MSEIRERAEAAGVVVASGFFRIAFYVCIVVLLFWIGKSAYDDKLIAYYGKERTKECWERWKRHDIE